SFPQLPNFIKLNGADCGDHTRYAAFDAKLLSTVSIQIYSC
ncbi:unnamed protein product, partial [Callosobruchus maculatus]